VTVTRVGVLISGRGSNLAALLDAAALPDAPYTIVAVISNRAGAAGLVCAREASRVAVYAVERAGVASRAAQQAEMARLLRAHGVEVVVTAGFDQILGPAFVDAYPERILNIHPSLLPAFAGTLRAQEEALAAGVKVSGCTAHLVTAEVDAGPIVAQAAVPVRDDDTVATLSARILAEEHRLLPHAMRLLATGQVRVEGRRAVIIAPPPHPPAHG